MRFELKTQNDNYSHLFPHFLVIFIFALIIILCNVAIKLGIISRHYQIEYNCKLLSVEKSKTYFKKLSRLSNLKSKQRIWDFCKEVVN
tara:strand:- start:1248 stop:1511 length:264 start_codon:yes stop_codon:yes gene_type:complete